MGMKKDGAMHLPPMHVMDDGDFFLREVWMIGWKRLRGRGGVCQALATSHVKTLF